MAQLSITSSVNADDKVEFAIAATFGEQAAVNETIQFAHLPAASRDHIIRVGLTNILRDSMAGKASEDVEARQAFVDKLARVLSGDVSGAARGPRKDPETKAREGYLVEIITAHCKAKGITAPKGKDLTEAMERVYAANKTKVDAEAKRRMKATAIEIEISL